MRGFFTSSSTRLSPIRIRPPTAVISLIMGSVMNSPASAPRIASPPCTPNTVNTLNSTPIPRLAAKAIDEKKSRVLLIASWSKPDASPMPS